MRSTALSESTSQSANIRGRPAPFRLKRHFLLWIDTVDPEVRATISDPAAWLGVTVLAGFVIVAAGVVPATRQFFRLDVVSAVVAYVPIFLVGMSLGVLQKRGAVSVAGFGMLALFGIACFQFFMWSLVGLSKLPGATVMASLPILLACYHGYALRSAPGTPYVAGAIAVGGIVGSLVHRQADTLPIFALGIPVATGCALILGRNSLAHYQERLRSVALREAVDAQLLTERARHVEVLSQALARLQGTSHDASNALSGVLFNLEQMAVEASRRPLRPENCERIGDMAHDLSSGLNTLRDLLLSARDLTRESLPKLEVVNVGAILQRVLENTKTRFAHITFEKHLRLRDEAAIGCITGGANTLVRVLSNLLTNACEGNGTQSASVVSVELNADSENLVLTIGDDGPGFSTALLDTPFREVHTTKAGGIGLGLYVSERLLRASGGRLRLANNASGGAQAELTLQRLRPG